MSHKKLLIELESHLIMSQTSFLNKSKFKDKYIILQDEIYGEGCFGQVYSCRRIDNTDPTIYCVKIIPIHQENKKLIQKIEIDIIIKTTISELNKNNPYQINLVQIFDIFYKSYLYIVMEQCDEDLQIEFDKMKIMNGYNEEQVLDVIQQIITGYQQLYQLKLIHNDIKPENILIKQMNEKYIKFQTLVQVD